MPKLVHQFTKRLGILERWFNLRFGWFFTNGMKEQHQDDPVDLKV